MAQAALVLANYDEDVVRYVTHPLTGLQSRLKFPPTISEITEAGNARVAEKVKEAELDAWRERKRRSDELKKLGGPRHSAMERPGLMSWAQMEAYCTERGIQMKPLGRYETMLYEQGVREKAALENQ